MWMALSVSLGLCTTGCMCLATHRDLTGHHDWECIIVGNTLHLIYCRRTNDEQCKPLTIASFNAEQAMMLTQQQGLLHPGKRRPRATPVAAELTPTIQLVVNVPPQAVSSHSMGGAQAMSLDYKKDSDGESPFHETSGHIMKRSSLVGKCLDPLWQTMT